MSLRIGPPNREAVPVVLPDGAVLPGLLQLIGVGVVVGILVVLVCGTMPAVRSLAGNHLHFGAGGARKQIGIVCGYAELFDAFHWRWNGGAICAFESICITSVAFSIAGRISTVQAEGVLIGEGSCNSATCGVTLS